MIVTEYKLTCSNCRTIINTGKNLRDIEEDHYELFQLLETLNIVCDACLRNCKDMPGLLKIPYVDKNSANNLITSKTIEDDIYRIENRFKIYGGRY